VLPERGVGWGEAEVSVDALKGTEDRDVKEKCRKRAIKGDAVEHLDDAEVGEFGVVLVVREEDAEGRADALGGKLHDELSEVELLLGRISDVLWKKNESTLDSLLSNGEELMLFFSNRACLVSVQM
jgi:hypothetical protein